MKIRVPQLNIWVSFWTLLGAAPTPLPYDQQYEALSTGLIDAIDSDVFSINGFKFYEQAKYLTLTGHWFLPKAVRVNAAWLDSLPADLQELVRTSAKEVFAEQRTTNRANAAAVLEELKGLGVEVSQLPAEELAKMEELTAPLFDEFGSQEPRDRRDDRGHPRSRPKASRCMGVHAEMDAAPEGAAADTVQTGFAGCRRPDRGDDLRRC